MRVDDIERRRVAECSLVNAMRLATQAYEGQVRGDGSAYISHPLAVWAELCGAGPHQADLGAVALLHDVLEERPGEEAWWLARIERDVGADVAMLVGQWLTDAPNRSKWDRRRDQLRRFAQADVPEAACHVKLADRVANLRIPSPRWHMVKRRFYAKHSLDLLATMRVVHPVLACRMREILARPYWTEEAVGAG